VASPQQLALGGELYRQSCAACHGPRGEGVAGSNAPPLQTLGSLDDVKLMVGRGSAEMPGMSALLTPEQIDAVSRYVLVQLAAQ
jgi:mono/diheme cytochrome c family protein